MKSHEVWGWVGVILLIAGIFSGLELTKLGVVCLLGSDIISAVNKKG